MSTSAFIKVEVQMLVWWRNVKCSARKKTVYLSLYVETFVETTRIVSNINISAAIYTHTTAED